MSIVTITNQSPFQFSKCASVGSREVLIRSGEGGMKALIIRQVLDNISKVWRGQSIILKGFNLN
jgi:hypothetical protein